MCQTLSSVTATTLDMQLYNHTSISSNALIITFHPLKIIVSPLSLQNDNCHTNERLKT